MPFFARWFVGVSVYVAVSTSPWKEPLFVHCGGSTPDLELRTQHLQSPTLQDKKNILPFDYYVIIFINTLPLHTPLVLEQSQQHLNI